jgi:hypothetical protein
MAGVRSMPRPWKAPALKHLLSLDFDSRRAGTDLQRLLPVGYDLFAALSLMSSSAEVPTMVRRMRFRPRVEPLDDRVVLSHLAPAAIVHAQVSHFHVATLTFQGTYIIQAARTDVPAYRPISFGVFTPVNVSGLGHIVLGGAVVAQGPGLALPKMAKAGSAIGVNNYLFTGANPMSPGQFNLGLTQKVAPPSKGYTLAYKFKIVFHSGQFAGAAGGGKVELKLNPKPPLTANAPQGTQYTGQCTIRFHFNPTTVLT